jgi:tetratricopeptide (TPR) repeat protein
MYLDQNNLDAAAMYITTLLQLNKDDVMSRYLSGRLQLAQQHVAEAITILNKVVQEWPHLAPAQYTLGLAYRQQQRFPQAKTAFAEAIKLAPSDVAPHLALGTLYLQGARSHFSGQASNRARCEVAIRFNMFHRPAL